MFLDVLLSNPWSMSAYVTFIFNMGLLFGEYANDKVLSEYATYHAPVEQREPTTPPKGTSSQREKKATTRVKFKREKSAPGISNIGASIFSPMPSTSKQGPQNNNTTSNAVRIF